MRIIQIKEVEFGQDDRGWSIQPITDEDIKSGMIGDIHMVSMKPGVIRGNHYHEYKTENILVIGSTCRVVVMDNITKEREERVIEDNKKVLFVVPPNITHAIKNVGKEMSYLFCYSNAKKYLDKHDIVRNLII